MGRKLDDVLCHFVQQQGSVDMLVHLRYSLDCNDVRVKNGELFFELERYGNVSLLDVLIRLEQNVMSVLILPVLLLLRCDCNCDLSSVPEVLENPVQAISVDRILRLSISLAHKVVEQLLNQMFLTRIALDQ